MLHTSLGGGGCRCGSKVTAGATTRDIDMFILPALKSSPHGSNISPQSLLATTGTVEYLHAPTLPPTMLSSWGIPFFSTLPEEGMARTELVGEYLLGLARLVRLRNASLEAAFKTAIECVVRDEEVEREFILEDGCLMARRCFIDYTRREAQFRVEKREKRERSRIIDALFLSTLALICHSEMLHRKHVATQFLDSLFLKLCQVKPGWMWRRVPCVFDDEGAVKRTTPFVPPGARALAAEESDRRGCVMANFFSSLHLALTVFVAGQKRIMFEAQRLQPGVTARSKMERGAIVIQSAFRGYHIRRRGVTAVGGRRCGTSM